jgi:hypothetical protein
LSLRTASSPLHIRIRGEFQKEEPKYAMNKQPLKVNADRKTRQNWEERRERTSTDEQRM